MIHYVLNSFFVVDRGYLPASEFITGYFNIYSVLHRFITGHSNILHHNFLERPSWVTGLVWLREKVDMFTNNCTVKCHGCILNSISFIHNFELYSQRYQIIEHKIVILHFTDQNTVLYALHLTAWKFWTNQRDVIN